MKRPRRAWRPSEVVAEQGDVIVEGPDGVAVTLTAAASEARRQIDDAGPHGPNP